MTVEFLKMTSFKAKNGLWVATLTETTTFLGVKIRTNNIIASDVVLTSSCVIPTIDETTGVVSDYPVNRNDVFFAIRTQYKVFLVENSDEQQ